MYFRPYFLSIYFIFILILLPIYALAWSGKVIDVIDGDSLIVLRGENEIEVRLYGIDSPAYDQPFGSEATKFTSKTACMKRVEVEGLDIDKNGRTVALVYIEGDGECLNEELVRAGYAWVYERYCHIRDCQHWQKLETVARVSDKGLWSQSNPIPPWEWRHGKRSESDNGRP